MTYSQESLNKLYQFKSERKYIEMMALLADLNGGELLSTEYVSYKHQYEFLLKKGDKSTHFFRGLNSICQHENFKYAFPQSIENVHRKNESSQSKYLKLKAKAVELGGELLEKEWLGCSVRHRFRIYNEEVMLTPKEVTRSGLATPSRGLITEPLIKQVFEHLFGYSFNKSRRVLTTDLTNTIAAMELDGYCEELKIAFEYQGHPSHWRKEHVRYEQTVASDKLKVKLCKKLGITLVVIDNIKSGKYSDSQFFYDIVLKNCKKAFAQNKKDMPAINPKTFRADMSKTHHYHESLANLKSKAQEKGFILLDKEWKGCSHIYKFEHIATKKVIEMTSLRVNHHERGLPDDIEKHFAIKNSKDKTLMLKKFKDLLEENGWKLKEDKWNGISSLHKIQHTVTQDVIEVKPSNVFKSVSNILKQKYNSFLTAQA